MRHRSGAARPPIRGLAVVQAHPQGGAGELAVELMTEVGVDVIVPWAAERCVARWRGERGERAAGPVAVHRAGKRPSRPGAAGSPR